MEDETEEAKSVELVREDLGIPEDKKEKKDTVDTVKQISELVNNDGIQMLLKGISNKYFPANELPTATVEQSPDEKLQRVLNVLAHLQQTLSPDATLKQSIEWIAKNSDDFKAIL